MGSPAQRLPDASRQRARQQKIERALRAAEMLQQTARWNGEAPHLDPRLLLRGLTAAPARYLVFQVGQDRVVVERIRLGRLARLAPRLPDLTAYIASGALCFRWRGGRGGLNLRASVLPARHSEDVFKVELCPPGEPRPARLLGDVLSEILAQLQPT